ncbi:S8 family serine peptidase [Marinihelvus fidelis]|nr:S8 family serine peptidase [Marinihelvus fidelis]
MSTFLNSRPARALIVLLAAALASTALGKSADGRRTTATTQRYIVIYADDPLVRHLSNAPRDTAVLTSARHSAAKLPAGRLNVHSPTAASYMAVLDASQRDIEARASALLGRDLEPARRYRVATNGIAVDLDATEVKRLGKLDGIAGIYPDLVHRMNTDSGPVWIGADAIWNGLDGIPATEGEGVVVGIIDSGINWEHLSFADAGDDGGYDFVNPYGEQLGLCSQEDVLCNDKLVGVYDFVEDDPNTEVVEENTDGRDNTDHGSHVSSIAAGNPLSGLSIGSSPLVLSGVAPNANIVSYRACFLGDPDDFDDDGCQSSALLEAIDQAILDEVDVINYSIGSGPFSPWQAPTAMAFLEAYEAGIFVATSAGNDGPAAGSVGNPAMAPWIVAVGSATHDRVFANVLQNMQGGDTTPPMDMYGTSGTDQSPLGLTDIVHAADYGFPLCGTGPAELGQFCEDNTGASNPFEDGTFTGKIVVCDRGTYGRVEKGKNVLEAGAAGYVLANTELNGEATDSDEHCLPATHVGKTDGDILRSWLDSGIGHQAAFSGFTIAHVDSAGDLLSSFSSRGPTRPPAEDILKPNLLAPGFDILGASSEGAGAQSGFVFLNGTSMASPHVAGAAALLRAVDPDTTPAMIASALQLTATRELARNEVGEPATLHEVGHGRPRLSEAARAGLYFDETWTNFSAANPAFGGEPRNLNLPSLMDANCADSCEFTRVVKPLVPGKEWTVTPMDFPEGVEVTVTPGTFTLADGAEQSLAITVDVTGSSQIGDWVFGEIRMTADAVPDASMVVAVFASGGDLPAELDIASDQGAGTQVFELSGLAEITQGVYSAGGFVGLQKRTEGLVEDPSFDNAYDGGAGTFTQLVNVPADALWLHSSTEASDALDLDLFVGYDTNGNGLADESEELCASTTPEDLELCDIFTPREGQWWIVVQNWEDGIDEGGAGNGTTEQDATLVWGVVAESADSNLVATGPGIVEGGATFPLQVGWDNVAAVPGQRLMGAIAIGRSQATPGDIGVVPVWFQRSGLGSFPTRVLADERSHRFALAAGESRENLVIDVPPGTSKLTVSASGGNAEQNNGLELSLYRRDFDGAFTSAPNAAPLPAGSAEATMSGSGGVGPEIVIENPVVTGGESVSPGRWYAVVSNNGGSTAVVTVQADLEAGDNVIEPSWGLWQPASRPGLRQGYEYNVGGPNRAFLWYTFDSTGQPAWYLASGPDEGGNAWTADLYRFTNDGQTQWGAVVGEMTITVLDTHDQVFSWTLYGQSGTDRMEALARGCPTVGGSEQSISGSWYRGTAGLGGASVLVDGNNQGHIHYLFDDSGEPRWLTASGTADAGEMSLLQFEGYCASCAGNTAEISFSEVGTLMADFFSEDEGTWTLNYLFESPLSGNVDRTDVVEKLTNPVSCE